MTADIYTFSIDLSIDWYQVSHTTIFTCHYRDPVLERFLLKRISCIFLADLERGENRQKEARVNHSGRFG